MKYNLRAIMLRAWKNYRKMRLSFAECLHRAWLSAKAEEVNTKRIENAKAAAGINEDTNTWNGGKQLGYEVIHGSRNLNDIRGEHIQKLYNDLVKEGYTHSCTHNAVNSDKLE